ncbi:hypothetical protein Tco_0000797 [Tanacetum coccineum]
MLKHLRHELDEAQKALDLDTFNATIREDEAVYLQAFNDALNLDERFLRQKAKIEWLRSVSSREVQDAILFMGNNNSLGPNGYMTAFLRRIGTLLRSNIQVKDSKIDLLVQQYEQFTILEEESIDSGFARFNTIITSLKVLDCHTPK